jgi:nitrile hydratase
VNGIHDMGGMHGMGPIEYEENEPVFHTRWEASVLAMTLAAGAWRKWNIDAGRHQIELIPPADYFRMSYYEKWTERLVELLVHHGLVTLEEIASGWPQPGSPKFLPPLTAEMVTPAIARGGSARRNVQVAARYREGQHVRARNINPTGHTRLPRYARGKTGVIQRDHGVFVFPDSNAQFLGEAPQHVYSVRFEARELWGPQASARDSVYIDMWDDYLEPV